MIERRGGYLGERDRVSHLTAQRYSTIQVYVDYLSSIYIAQTENLRDGYIRPGEYPWRGPIRAAVSLVLFFLLLFWEGGSVISVWLPPPPLPRTGCHEEEVLNFGGGIVVWELGRRGKTKCEGTTHTQDVSGRGASSHV